MPYDPYRPIREELARAGSTLERGLTMSAASKAREQELALAHEARMTGLGLQKKRLGLETERLGESKLTGALQREAIQQKIDTHNIQVDLDNLSGIIGQENAMNVGRIFMKKGGTVNEDGTLSKTVPLGAMPSIMSMLAPAFQRGGIQHFIQDTKGENWGIKSDGSKVRLGIISPLKKGEKEGRTFSQDMNEIMVKAHMNSITAIDKMIALGQKENAMGMLVELTERDKDQLAKKRKEVMKEINHLRGVIEKKDIPRKDSPEGKDDPSAILKNILGALNEREATKKPKKPDLAPSVRKPIEPPGLIR